jgi:polyhydroxyalkanoate synthesis regulator phasin
MTYAERHDARREQMLRELASNLSDMVEAGELTADEANEWLSAKADQWAGEC